MNCTICGKRVILVPSAAARARAECALQKRESDTADLLRRVKSS